MRCAFLQIGVVIRADTFQGPYQVIARNACGPGEDMYIWQDTRGHWHCVWHNTGLTSTHHGPHQDGGHSFSIDGHDPWYCVDGKGGHGLCTPDTPAPYNTTLWHTSADGSVATTVMGTRERPHMLFNDDGSPLALVTATRYCNGSSTALCASDVPPGYSDRSFTSVALLRQAGPNGSSIQSTDDIGVDARSGSRSFVGWQRGNFTVVTVPAQFTGYSVRVRNQTWLTDGAVALQCGGTRYSTTAGTLLLLSNQDSTGTDPKLGRWDAVTAEWSAGDCTTLTTSIVYFVTRDVFDFRTIVGANGANDTNTLPASARSHGSFYKPLAASTATEFPSFPPPRPAFGLGFITWNGDALGSNEHLHRPVPHSTGSASSADFKAYIGGLVSGPLVLFGGADGGASSDHPPAVVISPANEFDVTRLMHTHGEPGQSTRIVAGAQGMIKTLPASFTLRFLLSGREGVNAAMAAWGKTIKLMHGTKKFSLDEDTLSRQLHYVNDNGANYCYCHWWPKCQQEGNCVPMHVTLTQLKEEHKSLGLQVGHYHLDPFWWSQQPFGGCENGATAPNMSASAFHFAGQQISSLGLDMQLIVKYINGTDNVYTPEYSFDTKQVIGKDAYRFYHWLFQYHYNASNLRSLVWDGLDEIWLSSDNRVTSVTEQTLWHAGFANAATELGLPMRVDMSQPADTLASVLYPSHTVGRCMPDATPGDQGAWMDIAGNSLFLSALGVRPMMDVLWSTSIQPGNPYHESRPNCEHDFIFTTLSTGPLGIGDMLNRTNVTLINAAIRTDGVILKPSSAALRLDRFYRVPCPTDTTTPDQAQRYEVTAAATTPAVHASSVLDDRADSRADLERENEILWWNILSTDKLSQTDDSMFSRKATTCTDVQNNTAFSGSPIGANYTATTPEQCCVACAANPSCQFWNLNAPKLTTSPGCFFKAPGNTRHKQLGVTAGKRAGPALPQPLAAPLRLAEMWPIPRMTTEYWVQEWGNASCLNGSHASSCLSRWSWRTNLKIAATTDRHRVYPQTTRLYRFFRAAPVLSSGWTLLGELSKFVPVSPQRLVLRDSGGHSDSLSNAVDSNEVASNTTLSFDVIGANGEQVSLAFVTPQSHVLWLSLTISSTGTATVICSGVRCHSLHVRPRHLHMK